LNFSGSSSGHSSGIEANVNNISSGNLTVDDEWHLKCLANDGTENATSWQTSSTATIFSATIPRISYIAINATRFNSTEILKGFAQQ